MGINLHLGDCVAGMAQFDDDHFDLAIVDPQYGISVNSMPFLKAENKKVRQRNGSHLLVNVNRAKPKSWDAAPPGQDYFDELFRVSKHQIIWGINYMPITVGPGRLVWDKMVPDNVSFSNYEIAYCSMINGVRKIAYMWSGFSQGSRLDGTKQEGNKKEKNERRIHSTQKPVRLYEMILDKFAKRGDKILDTHAGSFSSGIAAYNLGFDMEAFEIDVDYHRSAKQRFTKQTAQRIIEY